MLLLAEIIEPTQPRLTLGQIGLTITTKSLFGFFHLRRHRLAERKEDANALLDSELLSRTTFSPSDLIPAFP